MFKKIGSCVFFTFSFSLVLFFLYNHLEKSYFNNIDNKDINITDTIPEVNIRNISDLKKAVIELDKEVTRELEFLEKIDKANKLQQKIMSDLSKLPRIEMDLNYTNNRVLKVIEKNNCICR